jgi:hypothetical protein
MSNYRDLAQHLADELEQAASQLRQYRAIRSADRYAAAIPLPEGRDA